MLPEEKYKELRKELDECNNPLFLYDDDPDGLSSFLLLYRYKREGHGVFVKSVPRVSANFLRQVERYSPDKIFILDMPNIEEEFFEGVKVPIIWVDHHPHDYEPSHIKVYNPHDYSKEDGNTSTTALCYNTIKQDLWIATIGAVGDWMVPNYIEEFREKYNDLLPEKIESAPQLLFDSPLSRIIMMFSMVLKGDTKISKKCIEALTKIKSPYDLINGDSEHAKYIIKKTKPMFDEHNKLLDKAIKTKDDDGVIAFIYDADKFSFSKEVSNYLQYKNPDKVVIVGRKKSGEYKLSIRSQEIVIPQILNEALAGLEGYGGGHEHACGACINELHFDEFLEKLKKGFKKERKK